MDISMRTLKILHTLFLTYILKFIGMCITQRKGRDQYSSRHTTTKIKMMW